MLDAYASVGMPVNYRHWSFGKQFIASEKSYRRGHMGLAYEIVINSDPCIAYLMEENTMPMQALVMAHACFGHNSLLQGQLPVPHVDGRQLHHRLPGLRQELHRRMRGAPRHRGGGAAARRLPCADELRRRPLPPPAEDLAGRGRAAPQGARGLPAAAGQRPVAHAAAKAAASSTTKEQRALSRGAAGKHPVLHREERAAAGALAARDRAHRAQGRRSISIRSARPR